MPVPRPPTGAALFSRTAPVRARTVSTIVLAVSPGVFSALLALTSGCAGPKMAPPPAMGDLSGAWLLETESQPVRFVNGDGDTLSLTVGREPLMLRQGAAVSDSSIAVEIVGIFVSGAMHVSKGLDDRSTDAEFVTAGPTAGTLSFRAPALSFLGNWNGREFSGHFQVDEERLGKDAKALDPKQAWSLRRLEGGRRISN